MNMSYQQLIIIAYGKSKAKQNPKQKTRGICFQHLPRETNRHLFFNLKNKQIYGKL